MDDSFLEWPVRYTPVMTPFSKGEQRQAPVFPLSIPNAPFDAFGPIPPGRLYPHGDAVISLGAMPIVPIPRVPMPPMPTLALTPVLLPKQGLPVRPTTLPRPLMISRHMSIPIVLQRPRHPTDYSARRPSLPSPQPRPSDDPILPPPIIPPVERYLPPPKPDVGCLFGSGTPGAPMLRSSRSEINLRGCGMLDVEPITKGPYTSEETPQGPPPAPVFIGCGRSDKALLPVLAEAPSVEGLGRSVGSEPFHDAEYPTNVEGLPRPRNPSSTSQCAFGRRKSSAGREASSRRMSSPIIPLDVDITRHPWQKKRQLWQRPEHRFTMFGLISYLTPAKQGGEDIVLPPHLPLGRLNWNILEPPSKATLIFPDGRSKPLGNSELETLAVAPPRKTIYLVYEPPAGDRVMMTIRGSPGSVTVRNVLDDMWGYLQKEYSHKDIKDRLADEPDNQSSLIDQHIHSKDPTYTQRQPLYRFLLDHIFFGGIIYDGERLSKALGSRYPSDDVWFLQFNDGPQPPPLQ